MGDYPARSGRKLHYRERMTARRTGRAPERSREAGDRADELRRVQERRSEGGELTEKDVAEAEEHLTQARRHAGSVEPEILRLDAVNRRGRAVSVQVTITELAHAEEDDVTGALLMMEVLDS